MKRVRYFDVLRIVCCGMIFFYHMLVQLPLDGVCPASAVSGWYAIGGMHMGVLAVAVFFMLSGAGLALSTRDGLRLGAFYRKRLTRLLLPYYVVTLGFYALTSLSHGAFLDVLPRDVPLARYVFTLLGMDEWVSMHGIPTYSCGIGEWFLGALIVLTMFFPLLRLLIRKWPLPTLAAATVVYGVIVYRGQWLVPLHMALPLKGFEFILGIYLGYYHDRIPRAVFLVALPAAAVLILPRAAWMADAPLRTTLAAALFVLSFSNLEGLLRRGEGKALRLLSGYTYEVFLVHHVVISFATHRLKPWLDQQYKFALLALIELALTVVSALALRWICGRITGWARRRQEKRARTS